VENSQYNLCVEVLKRMHKAGVLRNIVLIGSWCGLFYKEYFSGQRYIASITTRDMDLLVPVPMNIKDKVDIEDLLKDLGFILGFKGSEGYIKLEHPELTVEFLVPERGAGTDKPFKLPQLGLNAQKLRYLDLLTTKIIRVEVDGFKINLPHPALFSLHKLIVSGERRNNEKKQKDQEAALKIMKALIVKGELDKLRFFFSSFHVKLRNRIVKVLNDLGENSLGKSLIDEASINN
jgi:hypothetical protein